MFRISQNRFTRTSGTAAGGQKVTITGTNLTGATKIVFGFNQQGTAITCTATSCKVTKPPNMGVTIDVQVTTPGGTSAVTAADRYTFQQAHR